MNRRTFLRTAAGAGLSAPATHAWGEPAAESKPLRVGLIGCGWYGKSDLCRLLQVAPAEVVSLCDVDKRMLSEAAGLVAQRQASHKTPRTYGDYRAMLGEKDLDLVLVATPDHWHALAAVAALRGGSHLYLQKPVSVDVMEGETILAEARRLGRTVQIGTQRRSTRKTDTHILNFCLRLDIRWAAVFPAGVVMHELTPWSGPAFCRMRSVLLAHHPPQRRRGWTSIGRHGPAPTPAGRLPWPNSVPPARPRTATAILRPGSAWAFPSAYASAPPDRNTSRLARTQTPIY